jgi:hypothetical protein
MENQPTEPRKSGVAEKMVIAASVSVILVSLFAAITLWIHYYLPSQRSASAPSGTGAPLCVAARPQAAAGGWGSVLDRRNASRRTVPQAPSATPGWDAPMNLTVRSEFLGAL